MGQPHCYANPNVAVSARSIGDGQDTADMLLVCAELLFVNGETTQRTIETVAALCSALGIQATLFPTWGELELRVGHRGAECYHVTAVMPAGVEMRKVAAVVDLVDDLRTERSNAAIAHQALAAAARTAPISLLRFATMAGAGAAALGVIFGVQHLLGLALIAGSAGAGAALRRWLAGRTGNLFAQPFCAALLAGAVGAAASRLFPGLAWPLVALCPCMILVPGPHILNGALDAARGRLPLAAARLLYAALIIAAVCTGLLAGLASGGVDLPISGPSAPAPLLFDVAAAGVAVAAYGTFFAMPWRTLPIPVLIGMAAHACRWVVLVELGASTATGAFAACLLVSVVATPVADRLRIPFAAFAFTCVVSLLPGVFLFRMAGGLARLATSATPQPALLLGTAADAATALLVVLAIAVGLVVPKLVIEHLFSRSGFRSTVGR